MSHYTMLSKQGYCTRLLKIKNKLKIAFFFANKVGKNFRYFVGVFNKRIIGPLALDGYEMIVANLYLTRTSAIIVKYLFFSCVCYFAQP